MYFLLFPLRELFFASMRLLDQNSLNASPFGCVSRVHDDRRGSSGTAFPLPRFIIGNWRGTRLLREWLATSDVYWEQALVETRSEREREREKEWESTRILYKECSNVLKLYAKITVKRNSTTSVWICFIKRSSFFLVKKQNHVKFILSIKTTASLLNYTPKS